MSHIGALCQFRRTRRDVSASTHESSQDERGFKGGRAVGFKERLLGAEWPKESSKHTFADRAFLRAHEENVSGDGDVRCDAGDRWGAGGEPKTIQNASSG